MYCCWSDHLGQVALRQDQGQHGPRPGLHGAGHRARVRQPGGQVESEHLAQRKEGLLLDKSYHKACEDDGYGVDGGDEGKDV